MTSFTPGAWMAGHFTDDSHSCNCTSILSGVRMGSVAQITIDNGLLISDGGNDGPPPEEAKANARLIAAAPDMYGALEAVRAWTVENDFGRAGQPREAALYLKIEAALSKANGEAA